MDTLPVCPNCGTPLPAGAAQDQCPQCLAGGVLDTNPEGAGARIGSYKLLQLIGEGGMGSVWMAEQTEPVRRKVALKVVKLGMDTKQVIARFEAERQALVLMDHPNIAKVLDGGATENGRPYFVMELVRGIRITDYCDQNHLFTSDRLGLFTQVCHAVQHAHQKGIIHRDIKPSNILVTLHDGMPVPKVIDFGIAKATSDQRLTDKTLFTAFEQFLGTPAYMSPEQAEMSGLDIDTRTDIYSLGVLLYELLTGRTPFDSKMLLRAGLDEMRRILRETDPPRPSTRLRSLTMEEATEVSRRFKQAPAKLATFVSGDLDWIVMKSLEKDRNRRYETANGLAMDVQRHLRNERVLASPPTVRYRLQKFASRHRAAVAVAGTFFLFLGVATAVSIWLAVWANRERSRAEQARRDADQKAEAEARARDDANQQRRHAEESYSKVADMLDQMDLDKVENLFKSDDPMTALAYLGRVLRHSPSNRVAVARLMDTLTRRNLPLPIAVIQLDAPLRHIEFSRDGRRLVTVSEDKVARIWDPVTGEPLSPPMSHEKEINGVSFSLDSDRLVTLVGTPGPGSGLQVWDARTGRRISTITPSAGLRSTSWNRERTTLGKVVISPDGRQVFFSNRRGQLEAWDADTGEIVRSFQPFKGAEPLNVSGNGALLLAISPTVNLNGHQVRTNAFVLDAGTGKLRYSLVLDGGRFGHNPPPRFSADSRYLFDFGYFESAVCVRSANTGDRMTPPLEAYFRNSQNGEDPFRFRHLSIFNDSFQVMDWNSYRPVVGWRMEIKDQDPFWPNEGLAALSPDGSRLAARWKENAVRILDVRAGVPEYYESELIPGLAITAPPQFSPDGILLAYACSDNKARVFEARSGRLLADSVVHDKRIIALEFSLDGQWLTTAAEDGTARIWNAKTGAPIADPFRHETNVVASIISPRRNRLATVTSGGIVRIWSIDSGQLIGQGMPHKRSVLSVQWSPTREMIVSASSDGKARIWNSETGELLGESIAHSGEITCVRFSPDGRAVVTASSDRTARIWSVDTGTHITPPIRHNGAVVFADFSPDGSSVVTVADDQTARIWDARTGAPLTGQLSHERGGIRTAHFLENGHWLATAGMTPRVWDVRTGQPLTADLRPDVSELLGGSYIRVSPNGEALARSYGREVLPLVLAPLPIPNWLSDWAEAASGLRIDGRGGAEQVSFIEFAGIKKQVMEMSETNVYALWAKWFFSDRGTRQINPDSPVSVRQFVSESPHHQIVLRLSPTNALALAKSARSVLAGLRQERQYRTNRMVNALTGIELALEASPNEPEAWLARAEFWREVGNLEEALAAANSASQFAPSRPEIWLLLGSLFEKAIRPEEATKSYSKAIELAGMGDKSSTEIRSKALLGRITVLKQLNRTEEAQADFLSIRNIPPRNAKVPSRLIDLSQHYNASLNESWHSGTGQSDLSALTPGEQKLSDVDFDVRGLIQVGDWNRDRVEYPQQVTNISVRQICHRLHFLHSAIFATQTTNDTPIGHYLVHFSGGQTDTIPIVLGRDLANWRSRPNDDLSGTTVAWEGASRADQQRNRKVRLFKTTWTNPRPNEAIQSIDFVAGRVAAKPFLVAITAEP